MILAGAMHRNTHSDLKEGKTLLQEEYLVKQGLTCYLKAFRWLRHDQSGKKEQDFRQGRNTRPSDLDNPNSKFL